MLLFIPDEQQAKLKHFTKHILMEIFSPSYFSSKINDISICI